MTPAEILRLFAEESPVRDGKPVDIRVCTDSRSVTPGDCFVALAGEKFDGHDYLEEVAAKGASIAVVHRDAPAPRSLPLIRVDDTVAALQRAAARYRASLKIPIIAVGGSNGKTSTKEQIACVLGAKFQISKTEGNLNNHIGVPLTLLRIGAGTEAAVVELGTNHPGEIELLMKIARPDVSVVTNIGNEHLEFFMDQQGVFQEEGVLVELLPKDGLAVLNADCPYTTRMRQRARSGVVTGGFAEGADIRVSSREDTEAGQFFTIEHAGLNEKFELPVPGAHMASNASLSVAVGAAFEVPLWAMAQRLRGLKIPGGRMRSVTRGGITVIDDSYNANPSSMEAALAYLVSRQGRRIAVLGGMGELGGESERWHVHIGRKAADLGVDMLVAVGLSGQQYARGAYDRVSRVEIYADNATAGEFLKRELRKGDVVLFKASRSAKLEQVVEAVGFGGGSGGH